jgi:hypothetical protein
MKQVLQFLSQINPPTLIAAVLLVLAVLLVTRIGKVLLMAATVGSLAGGVSLGQGSPPRAATVHAAIGFAVAAATLFLIRFTKSLPLRLLITAAGVGVLLLYGFGR